MSSHIYLKQEIDMFTKLKGVVRSSQRTLRTRTLQHNNITYPTRKLS